MREQARWALLYFMLAVTLFVSGRASSQPTPPSPLAHLTQISDREFVDLSKVSAIRLPVYTPVVEGCPSCETRWGAIMLVDGGEVSYSTDAEARIRELLHVLK